MASDLQKLPFEDIIICVTGFSGEEKEDIHQKIREMGGKFAAKVSRSVTHVIAKTVGSEEYKMAVERSIPIVYPEWIHNSYLKWIAKQYFHARQSISTYILPPFPEFVICVTGFSFDERESIKALTEANGGTYSCDLTRKVTHLIAQKPEGKKYEFARFNGIQVVSDQWFAESICLRTCADVLKYSIPPTIIGLDFGPESFNSNSFSFSTPTPGRHCKEPAPFPKAFSPGPLPQNPELIAKTSNLSEMYLDGCNIYLGDGFNSQKLTYLKRIILEGGGTWKHKYSANGVTHFVISGRTPTEMDLVCLAKDKDAGQMPLFVMESWLHECYKENALIDAEKYLGDMPDWYRGTELTATSKSCASDRSRIGSLPRTSRALKTSTPKGKPKLTIRKSRLSTGSRYSINEILDDLVFDPSQENTGTQSTHSTNSQFRKASSRRGSIEFDSNEKSTGEANRIIGKSELALSKKRAAKLKAANLAELNSTQSTHSTQSTLFSGAILDAYGFGSQLVQAMEKEVVKHGGIFVSSSVVPTEKQRRNLTWYTIVRLKCRQDELPKVHGILVTGCWLDRCLNDHQICSPDEHISFAPLPSAFKLPIAEFTKYQIGVSGYDDLERVHLGQVVESLGAKYTQNFSRSHTHLLSCTAEGSKYIKAKEWGIPTITADWISQCVKEGKLIPLDNFYVDMAASTTSHSTRNNSEEPHYVISLSDTESPAELEEPNLAEPSVAGLAKRTTSMDLLEDLSPNTAAAHLATVEQKMDNMVINTLVDIQKESVQSPSIPMAILEGAILFLSKGLSCRQTELYTLITQLGGKWVSSYDDTVTHFIHQGKNTREVSRLAQRQVFIVSPIWLQQCFERSCRLDEKYFPYTYIPGRSNCLVFTQDPSTQNGSADKSEEGRENIAPSNVIPSMTGTERRAIGKTSTTLQEFIEKTNKDDMSKRRTRGIIRRSATEQSSGVENDEYIQYISKRAETIQCPLLKEKPVTYDDPEARREKRKILDQVQQSKKVRLSPDPEEKRNDGDDKDSVVSWGESKTGKSLYRSRTMDSEVPRMSQKDLTLSDERSTVPLAQRENSKVMPSISSRSELLGMTMTDFTISDFSRAASLRRTKTSDSTSTTSSKRNKPQRGSREIRDSPAF